MAGEDTGSVHTDESDIPALTVFAAAHKVEYAACHRVLRGAGSTLIRLRRSTGTRQLKRPLRIYSSFYSGQADACHRFSTGISLSIGLTSRPPGEERRALNVYGRHACRN
jgi:hypothetical protein